MAEVKKYIRTVKDNGDVILSNIIDSYTGESVEYIKVSPIGITPDGIIYRRMVTVEFGTETYKRIYSGVVDIKWFGAKQGTNFNSTTAIQAAIDYLASIGGGDLIIPEGNWGINTLSGKSNVNIICVGKLVQLTAAGLEVFESGNEDSDYPILNLTGVNNCNISLRSKGNYESVVALNSNNLTFNNCDVEGQNTTASFAGMLFYNCGRLSFSNNKVYNFGKKRTTLSDSSSGTGLRFLVCNNIYVDSTNEIYNNGENGLYFFATYNVNVLSPIIRDNDLSAVQIGFSGGLIEKNYTLTNIRGRNNGADLIDINNRDHPFMADINCIITGNSGINNGFVNGLSSPDGSGVCTLINVGGVTVIGSTSTLNNKPTMFLENVGYVKAIGINSDNDILIVGNANTCNLELINCKFRKLEFAGGVLLQSVKVSGGSIDGVVIPNSVTISKLTFDNVEFRNMDTLNLNLVGDVLIVNCSNMISLAGIAAILVVACTSFKYINSNLDSLAAEGLIIAPGAKNVVVNGVNILAADICIHDGGSTYPKYIDVNLKSKIISGRASKGIVLDNPNRAQLIRMSIDAGSDNSIKVNGTGTITQQDMYTIAGFPDYGAATVKTI